MTTCGICKEGVVERGTTTATFEADGTTVVIRNVPADVCREPNSSTPMKQRMSG